MHMILFFLEEWGENLMRVILNPQLKWEQQKIKWGSIHMKSILYIYKNLVMILICMKLYIYIRMCFEYCFFLEKFLHNFY